MPSYPNIPSPSKPFDSDVPCVKCGYNLRGLKPTGRCPECGEEIAATLARQNAIIHGPFIAHGLIAVATSLPAPFFLIFLLMIEMPDSSLFLGAWIIGEHVLRLWGVCRITNPRFVHASMQMTTREKSLWLRALTGIECAMAIAIIVAAATGFAMPVEISIVLLHAYVIARATVAILLGLLVDGFMSSIQTHPRVAGITGQLMAAIIVLLVLMTDSRAALGWPSWPRFDSGFVLAVVATIIAAVLMVSWCSIVLFWAASQLRRPA